MRAEAVRLAALERLPDLELASILGSNDLGQTLLAVVTPGCGAVSVRELRPVAWSDGG